MTKKEYILAVIDAMPDWEMGWGLKAMVQNDQLDSHTIDTLVVIFKKAMDQISDVIDKYKILEVGQSMENFNKQKEEQAKQDAENLAQLDSMLNDL